MAVKTREPACCVWLIHRGVPGHPRISLRYLESVGGKLCRKLWIQQVGMPGTTAVVKQANDGIHPQSSHHSKGVVKERPALCCLEILPVQGGPECLYVQRRNRREILFHVLSVTRPGMLIKVPLLHSIDRAFETTPKFYRAVRGSMCDVVLPRSAD